jgi:hypothetical protein
VDTGKEGQCAAFHCRQYDVDNGAPALCVMSPRTGGAQALLFRPHTPTTGAWPGPKGLFLEARMRGGLPN